MWFYDPARWGNRFGVKGPHYGPDGHRGLDIKAGAGVTVPALRAGRVALIGKSSILGWYVVIEVAQGDFDGYCHVLPAVELGDFLNVGATVGTVAGWGDYHGSAWDGPHLHLTEGPTVTSVHSGVVRDPAALINTLTPAAGGAVLIRGDDDMTLYYRPWDDSSPITVTGPHGLEYVYSRIWAGERDVAGIEYADVWAVADNGEGRRLTRKQWGDLQTVAGEKGIELPVIDCSGNQLEVIIHAPRI